MKDTQNKNQKSQNTDSLKSQSNKSDMSYKSDLSSKSDMSSKMNQTNKFGKTDADKKKADKNTGDKFDR